MELKKLVYYVTYVLLTIGMYVFVEKKVMSKNINMKWFYIIVAAISMIGLVVVNVFDFKLFESFFVLTLIFSVSDYIRKSMKGRN